MKKEYIRKICRTGGGECRTIVLPKKMCDKLGIVIGSKVAVSLGNDKSMRIKKYE